MGWLNNLRKLKEESGLSMREISAQSGMSEPTLEKIFAGKSKDPKLTTLLLLCEFFGCTLDYLAYGEEIEKAPTVSGEREQLVDLIPYLPDDVVHAMLVLAAQAGQQK